MSLPREEERDLFSRLSFKEASALIGPRRAGKSTLARRLLSAFEEKDGAGLYVDFELPNAPDIPELSRMVNYVPKGGLLVLDEVQALLGWERWVRSEIEYGKHRVLVTGSSATLLSKEIASSLAGRAIPNLVLPLSYRDAKAWGLTSLEKYLRVGGYPECVLRPDDASTLHKLYFELAVLRDVAARQGVREFKPLMDLAMLLLSESGKCLSSKKTAGSLGISQPTYRSFVQGLIDAFLVLSVPPFSRSPRERLVADSKHYAIDVGLQKSVSLSASDDAGRRLENVVAIELFRQGYALSYLPGTHECDFIASAPGSPVLAVQVCATGSIPKREIQGLERGLAVASKGLLLTSDEVAVDLPKNASAQTVSSWLLKRPA